MAMRLFLTFANAGYRNALQRIVREAEDSAFFDEICLCTEKDLDPVYIQKYGSWIEANKRGYGYWIWKSYLVKSFLEKLEFGDFLIYLDSGCEINKNAGKRYFDYLKLAAESSLGLVCFSTMSTERKFDKGDVLDALDMRDDAKALNSAQIMGGMMVICKKESSVALVKKWFDLVHNHLSLVDDSPSVSPNLEGFIENRHDQSVFSLLIKKTGGAVVLKGVDEVEIWPMTNRNWSRLYHTPFHAVRRNEISSRLGNGAPFSGLMNVIWQIENAFIDRYVACRVGFGACRRKLVGKR